MDAPDGPDVVTTAPLTVAAWPLPAARRRIGGRAFAIGASVVPFAVSFGALSTTAGFSVLQTCVLSLLLFSGASQFALVSIIAGGGGVASALGAALLLGLRNGLYATRVAVLVRPRGWRRLLAAQLTIDESTAMAVTEAELGAAAPAFWLTGLAVFVLWNVFTVVGAVLGGSIGDPASAGLDAAGPAAFVALLGPRLRAGPARRTAAVAALVALALVPVLPPGAPVLLGALVALALVAGPG